ncbi:MAG TPA: hypothetical protein VE155_07200 [Pseudonocardiaceae bacterium]|nr:hypothetical protein [Pseudonocardiaceae bacterium]
MSDPVRWVELPLRAVISIHQGFWMCLLCARSGRPGAGRFWEDSAGAEAAGLTHLDEVHRSPVLRPAPTASGRSIIEANHAQHVIEGSHDPDCPRCPVLE